MMNNFEQNTSYTESVETKRNRMMEENKNNTILTDSALKVLKQEDLEMIFKN
jgi:hypothetical protein